MIRIDMGITQRVHKISRLQSCHVSDHSSQKSITGNIEWNSYNKKINPIISWFANINFFYLNPYFIPSPISADL